MAGLSSRSLGAALLLGVAACTAGGSAPKPAQGAKTDEAEEKAEPEADEPEPEPEAPAEPPPPALPTEPTPAFVVYTLEQSFVVPIDGSGVSIGQGLWVQDDREALPTIRHNLMLSGERIEKLGLPPCPCSKIEGSCAADSLVRRTLEPADLAPEEGDGCRCVATTMAVGMPPPPPEDMDGMEFDEPCEMEGEEVVQSMVGGQLFFGGWEWNGACFMAMSIYDAISFDVDVVKGAPELSSKGMRELGCSHDMDPAATEPAWTEHGIGLACAEDGPGGCRDDCDEEYWESEVFVLRRGYLWSVRDSMMHAGASRSAARRPARKNDCPSINDPCGDPKAFDWTHEQPHEFWIATDESAALAAEEDRYVIHLAGEEKRELEFRLPDVHASNDVIGVRFHADVRKLLGAMQRNPDLGVKADGPALPPSACEDPGLEIDDQSFVDKRGGRDWGDRCVHHLRFDQYAAAEAACRKGLSMATEDSVKGALLFNLGRIAEDRGVVDYAADLYRQSLKVRPDNATTKERLESLNE